MVHIPITVGGIQAGPNVINNLRAIFQVYVRHNILNFTGNNIMKSVDIKGKQYVMVNERIKEFRKQYPDGQILTQILANSDGQILFQAKVLVDGVLVATGHAYEKEASSFINKTSYIENCETSAVGRALGILGIGIDASLASAEEVGNAVKQQEEFL